jgi:hypothetical protein
MWWALVLLVLLIPAGSGAQPVERFNQVVSIPAGTVESPSMMVTQTWTRCLVTLDRTNMQAADVLTVQVIEVSSGRVVGAIGTTGMTAVGTVCGRPENGCLSAFNVPCGVVAVGQEAKLRVQSNRAFTARVTLTTQ